MRTFASCVTQTSPAPPYFESFGADALFISIYSYWENQCPLKCGVPAPWVSLAKSIKELVVKHMMCIAFTINHLHHSLSSQKQIIKAIKPLSRSNHSPSPFGATYPPISNVILIVFFIIDSHASARRWSSNATAHLRQFICHTRHILSSLQLIPSCMWRVLFPLQEVHHGWEWGGRILMW